VNVTTAAYRRLIAQSSDAIVVSERGRVILINDTARTWFGSKEPGSDLLELFAGPSRDAVERQLAAASALTDSGGRIAAVVLLTDGRALPMEVTIVSLDGGDLQQVAIRDLPTHHTAWTELREREERLQLALAGTQEGVWDWNLDTGAVVYSARWKEMLGYRDDEIEPHVRAWERLIHPDDKARALAATGRLSEGDEGYHVECRLRHKNGQYIHVLSRGFPVRDPRDRRVIRIVGTHLDLTERKRAEMALQESEERLSLAFAGAQEGVWDWDLKTGAVVYSKRWKEMLGYEENEVEPHVTAWERLLHPDDRAKADALSESVRRGSPSYEGEFRLRHRDGHYVHVLSRGLPIRRQLDGPVVRIVGTHFDLSERKRAEDTLKRAHEELEQRVRERTGELARANESLTLEIRQREQAERARTELLGRLVFVQEDERRRIAREMHDQFGEHLTALSRSVERLFDLGSGSEAIRAEVGRLDDLAQRLDRDVEQLVWELRPTALDDLGLRAALSNYVRDWSARVGIPVQMHTSGLLDDRLPADIETTLYRIAQEALTNVAKHAGASRVDVLLERRPDAVVLAVEDNGAGFDTEAVPAPVDPAVPRSFGLLGMQERAALIGATLTVESTVGEGTTVLLRLTADTLSASVYA